MYVTGLLCELSAMPVAQGKVPSKWQSPPLLVTFQTSPSQGRKRSGLQWAFAVFTASMPQKLPGLWRRAKPLPGPLVRSSPVPGSPQTRSQAGPGLGKTHRARSLHAECCAPLLLASGAASGEASEGS